MKKLKKKYLTYVLCFTLGYTSCLLVINIQNSSKDTVTYRKENPYLKDTTSRKKKFLITPINED